MASSKEPKRQLLLSHLTQFFQQNPEHQETVAHIIQGASPISLRILDWFVTHYSKLHQVMYWFDPTVKNSELYLVCPKNPPTNLKKFHVYYEYRAQLKSYSKAHFDPFRRHERISFKLEENPNLMVLETTVGQLNFFRWAVQNRIIDYVKQHLPQIEQSVAEHGRAGRANSDTESDNKTKSKTKKKEKGPKLEQPTNIKQTKASYRVRFE